MIYETNKVKLHGIVSSKNKEDGRNVIKLTIGKDLDTIITCFVRDDIYFEIKPEKIYEIEGFLVPKDKDNNDLAIEINKYSLTDTFDGKQHVDVVFKITNSSQYTSNRTWVKSRVHDLTVDFINNNIKNLKVDVTLWDKLASLPDDMRNKKAFASCYIAINNKTKKLKLVPYYLRLLEVS